ncbi:MAG: hypothetical protein C0399_04475 [Syntrophus sp. (in: bacteria)]|nr:hypothetical protein [Syntrophus sp. (in: bacteria)]
MKRFILPTILLIMIIGAIAFYAPHYLVYTHKPVKSDSIVLFLGSKFTPRKEEAFKLIEDGYARYLIIPAYGKVSDAGLFTGQPGEPKLRPDTAKARGGAASALQYPKYFEDTHIEVLEAKKMIDKAGFKSAIFVSSPYHMRRISIIAKQVFGTNDYQLTFVPSRFEEYKGGLWFLNGRDLKFVTGEYLKIAWFMVYRFFPQNNYR